MNLNQNIKIAVDAIERIQPLIECFINQTKIWINERQMGIGRWLCFE
jgi:hypothetical protein